MRLLQLKWPAAWVRRCRPWACSSPANRSRPCKHITRRPNQCRCPRAILHSPKDKCPPRCYERATAFSHGRRASRGGWDTPLPARSHPHGPKGRHIARPDETKRVQHRDAGRIKPPHSPRVTALSACAGTEGRRHSFCDLRIVVTTEATTTSCRW